MRRILLIILQITLFVVLAQKPAQAIKPCDLSKVDAYKPAPIDFGVDYKCLPQEDINLVPNTRVCGVDENPCKDNAYVYCRAPQRFQDWGSTHNCFKQGETWEDPRCPEGTINMSSSADKTNFSTCLPYDPTVKKPICCKTNGSDLFCRDSGGRKVSDLCTKNDCNCFNATKTVTQERTCEYKEMVYDSKKGFCTVTGGNFQKIFLCLSGDSEGCDTAIGKINVSTPTKLIEVIMKLIVGIAGGIALIMLIFAGYQVAMSSGDPQKLQVAKEIFVSVLTGIALIALSMVLLRAIGVDLLGLPPLKSTPGNMDFNPDR